MQSKKNDSLESLLHDSFDDEKKGANATLGFTFQQWWAALTVAELLEKETDFAIVLEFKEDVALLDSSTEPTEIELYQVKKNERTAAWTINSLYAKGKKLSKGHELSILSKMYSRRTGFIGHPVKLHFISNVGIKTKSEDGKSMSILNGKIESLPQKDKDAITSAIASELALAPTSIGLSNIYISKTNLPLDQQELFVGGKLSELSSNSILPFSLPHSTVAARVLASHIQSKASKTSLACSFEELKPRLLSRDEALKILSETAYARPPTQTIIDNAISSLEAEKYSFLALREIKKYRVDICTAAATRTNTQFQLAASAMLSEFSLIVQCAPTHSLGGLMDLLVNNTQEAHPDATANLNKYYLCALALLVLNDGLNIDILPSPANTKSEGTE
nr:dsDNA nuclease domain-containing protein [Pseudomonas sp. LPH1]